MFKAIKSGPLVISLINESNFESVNNMFSGFPDSNYMQAELNQSYRPQYDDSGQRTKYGCCVHFRDELAGGTLLGISSWKHRRGYTGADILSHMRGKGIAPGCKPLLFYLAFEILGLNRVETGCLVSNKASISSITKTPGFVFEGTLREYIKNPEGIFEDEYRWAIIKSDWQEFYKNFEITVISE